MGTTTLILTIARKHMHYYKRYMPKRNTKHPQYSAIVDCFRAIRYYYITDTFLCYQMRFVDHAWMLYDVEIILVSWGYTRL